MHKMASNAADLKGTARQSDISDSYPWLWQIAHNLLLLSEPTWAHQYHNK